VDWFGYTQRYVILALALVGTAVMVWLLMRDAPDWQPNTTPVIPKLGAALRLVATWQMSFLYAVAFGGFVAFSTYLPTYLKDIYDFDLTAAGTRTAGFAIAAVLARPVGGVLADKVGARNVVTASMAGTGLLAIVVMLQPAPELPAGITFVLLALFLGLGTGGVFTWVSLRAPAAEVGSVSGLVGAAGGLGGYFPPLVMGATYNSIGADYTVGLSLLFIVTVIALLFTQFGVSRSTEEQSEERAGGTDR